MSGEANDPEIWVNRAAARANVRDFRSAIGDFRQALRLCSPDDPLRAEISDSLERVQADLERSEGLAPQ